MKNIKASIPGTANKASQILGKYLYKSTLDIGRLASGSEWETLYFSGHKLRYLKWFSDANKPTLVFLHGFMDLPESFIPCASLLKKHYNILVPSLAGFCNDYDSELTYNTELYVGLVSALLHKEKLEKIDLAGNSLGGAIALKFASEFPQAVEKLFAIDSAGLNLPEVQCIMDEVNRGENIFEIYCKEDFDNSLSRAFHKVPPMIKPVYEWLYLDYKYKSPRSEKIMMDLNDEFTNYTPQYKKDLLASIKAKTKVIWGDNDSLFPLELGRHLNELIPDSSLTILKNTGHVPHVESPIKLVKSILA